VNKASHNSKSIVLDVLDEPADWVQNTSPALLALTTKSNNQMPSELHLAVLQQEPEVQGALPKCLFTVAY
jgi:hypothetical protein